MTKKFKCWFWGKDYEEVDSFQDILDWFKSANGSTVRYNGCCVDKSAIWGAEWKKVYVLNYYSERDGSLYLDVAYCNFLEPEYIVTPKVNAIIATSMPVSINKCETHKIENQEYSIMYS